MELCLIIPSDESLSPVVDNRVRRVDVGEQGDTPKEVTPLLQEHLFCDHAAKSLTAPSTIPGRYHQPTIAGAAARATRKQRQLYTIPERYRYA
jgi:hypothetical protein